MAEPVRPSYAALFRNRNYLRVFSAGLGSVAGSAITAVCLVWLVAETTGSAVDVALLATSWVVSALVFSVFGGTLVDRYDRRRLMIGSDVARAVALGAVTVELAVHGFDLVSLLTAYAVVGAFTTIFNPAEQAIIPQIVGAIQVADANGLVRSSRSALQFAGAAVAGGLLVSVGPVAGLAANAATFALSAVLLTGMRIPRGEVRRQGVARPSYFSDVAGGFRWLWGARGFFQLTLSATFFNFCSTVVGTFLVFFATLVLHGGALDYALLLASLVAGSGLGALLVGRVGAVRWAGPAWTVPYGVVSGAVVLVMALWPSFPLGIVAMFALGALGGFAGTAWLSAAQLLVPPEMQGRYFGVDNLGSIAILPAAQIGGAFLVADYGPRTTYLVMGVLWVAAGAVFLVPRSLRELGYRPGEAPDVTLRSDGDVAGTSVSPGGTRGA
ncbi:MAG TPA: MFS transporter [Thermoplasmata archaeon]|nr:MFS transporter [Thermoplasmata archaeon]